MILSLEYPQILSLLIFEISYLLFWSNTILEIVSYHLKICIWYTTFTFITKSWILYFTIKLPPLSWYTYNPFIFPFLSTINKISTLKYKQNYDGEQSIPFMWTQKHISTSLLAMTRALSKHCQSIIILFVYFIWHKHYL